MRHEPQSILLGDRIGMLEAIAHYDLRARGALALPVATVVRLDDSGAVVDVCDDMDAAPVLGLGSREVRGA
ncbi:MAG: hypothetical protein ROR55_04650 [Devosia sp.]